MPALAFAGSASVIIIIIIIGDSYAETTGLRQPGIPPTNRR